MSISNSGTSGRYLTPPSSRLVGNIASTWSLVFWMNPASVAVNWQCYIYLAPDHAIQMDFANLHFWRGAEDVIAATLTTNTWYCVGVAQNGLTERRYFLDGAYVGNSTAITNENPAEAVIGQWSTTSDPINGRMGGLKVWDAFLSDAEMINEMGRIQPFLTDNIRHFYPLFGGGSSEWVRDYTGIGASGSKDAVLTGTFGDYTMPPVAYSVPRQTLFQGVASLYLTAAQSGSNIELAWV